MTEKTDIVYRLRLTPVLMRGDELGQNKIDYEACKKYVNDEGVKMMREAANEIERLRKELCECENLLDEYRRVEMDRDRWDYLREDTNE